LDLGVRGKGYVVVGGTAGMGLAAARALAREGASVVVVGRDADRGKNAAEEVAAAGAASAHGLAFDVSQPGAAVAAVDEAAVEACAAGLAEVRQRLDITHLADDTPLADVSGGEQARLDYFQVLRYAIATPSGEKWKSESDDARMQFVRVNGEWKIASGL